MSGDLNPSLDKIIRYLGLYVHVVCITIGYAQMYTSFTAAHWHTFLGAFDKISKSDCWLRHVGPSVRTQQLCSHWTEFYEI